MSQFTVYHISQDGRPIRAILAPASLSASAIHDQLRPGERVIWTGNLADALGGLPVSWLDNQRQQVLQAVAEMRGRAGVCEEEPAHTTLSRLFLGRPWRDTCWNCRDEINPFLEQCPHCGADTVPF